MSTGTARRRRARGCATPVLRCDLSPSRARRDTCLRPPAGLSAVAVAALAAAAATADDQARKLSVELRAEPTSTFPSLSFEGNDCRCVWAHFRSKNAGKMRAARRAQREEPAAAQAPEVLDVLLRLRAVARGPIPGPARRHAQPGQPVHRRRRGRAAPRPPVRALRLVWGARR